MNVRLLSTHQLCVLRLQFIVFEPRLQTGFQLTGNEAADINVIMIKFITLCN